MRRLLPHIAALLLLFLGLLPQLAFGAARKVTSETGEKARRATSTTQARVRRLVRIALSQIGTPYRYSGASPASGFDCSGFTRWVFARMGVGLPHSSYGQAVTGRFVPEKDLRPGDLVFFDGNGHVGIYIGDGRFVHAPHTGAVVRVEALDSPGWYYGGGRRVL